MGTDNNRKAASLAIIPSPNATDNDADMKNTTEPPVVDKVSDTLIMEKISCHGDVNMGVYVERHLREEPVLTELRIHANSLGSLQAMQISAAEGAVLQMLVRMLNAKRCLEVGFFTGYSALAVAMALPHDGLVTAIDVNSEWAAVGEKFFTDAQIRHKLDLRIQPGMEALDALIADAKNHGTFDFGFIDADKANSVHYYQKMLQLVRPGGAIAIDGVFWLDRVASEEHQDKDTKAMRALNDLISTDERIHLAYLPTADGVAVCYKK